MSSGNSISLFNKIFVLAMPIAIVRATYTEQTALETFFTGLFGYGKSQVIVRSEHTQAVKDNPYDAVTDGVL